MNIKAPTLCPQKLPPMLQKKTKKSYYYTFKNYIKQYMFLSFFPNLKREIKTMDNEVFNTTLCHLEKK